jgi:hypothetical protein
LDSRYNPLTIVKKSIQYPPRIYRAYLAEDYDGISQYVLTKLTHGGVSSGYKVRVAAGDHSGHTPMPEGTPITVTSVRGTLEALLGQKNRVFPGLNQGASDSWAAGSGSVSSGPAGGAIPILPHPMVLGDVLVLFWVVTDTGGPASDPVLNTVETADNYPWTTLESHHGVDSTSNINHSWPVPSGPGPAGCRVGLSVRMVESGDADLHKPVSVGAGGSHLVACWLWELPSKHTPSESTFIIMDDTTAPWLNPGPGGATNPVTIGSNMSGWTVGMFAIPGQDYGPTPIIAPSVGTTLRAPGSDYGHSGRDGVDRLNNNDILALSFGSSYRWAVPWCWIGQSPTGAALSVNMQHHDVPEGSPGSYNNFSNHLPVVGVACVIPELQESIIDIPYPANQSA